MNEINCFYCDKPKNINDFFRTNPPKPMCLECETQRAREYRKRYRDKMTPEQRKIYKTRWRANLTPERAQHYRDYQQAYKKRNLVRMQQSRREWKQSNPERVKRSQRYLKQRLRERVRSIKSRPCADCGVQYDPVCMDFDHRDGTQKVANVSALSGRAAEWRVIEAEIAKCEIVCSNCHRIRTARRASGLPYKEETTSGAGPEADQLSFLF